MPQFYVNKNAQSSGEHEVHTSICNYLPLPENRIFLGSFDNCASAVREAKKHFNNVDGCFYCCRPCHTR